MTLNAFFESACRRWPDAVALDIPPGQGRAARQTVTYRALHQRAGCLAAAIHPHVVGDDPIVAILLPRASIDAYAGPLGVLMSGAAFTAIDPSFPDERVRTILDDCRAVALVTDRAGGARARRLGVDTPQIAVPDASEWSGRVEGGGSCREAEASSLAYVIYTSGTTGRPKAVMVEHRAIANLIASDVEAFGLGPGDRVGQGSSHAYDSSIEEIWLAWSAGATVVVLDDEVVRSGPDLGPWLEAERVTVLCPPPTLLRTLEPGAGTRLRAVRLLYVGGEIGRAHV